MDKVDLVILALTKIREKHGKRVRVRGKIECPVCGRLLRYHIAYNGHIWGACEDNACISWMM